MSYDLRIYFPHEVFPEHDWERVLSLFQVKEHIKEDPKHRYYEKEWIVTVESRTELKPEREYATPETDPITGRTLWIDRSHIWMDLCRVPTVNQPDCVPIGSCWRIYLDLASSASPKAVWTQFAIPYYALCFIGGITVHDCQWHRDENMYSFQDADSWREFACMAVESRLWRWGQEHIYRSERDLLIEQGFMDEDGNVLF